MNTFDADGNIELPAGDAFLRADFSRSGPDLLIHTPVGNAYVIPDYFMVETPPALLTDDGAVLSAKLVTALAGPQAPGMVAQAAPGQAAQQGGNLGAPIGHVSDTEGSVTVTHPDGTQETLTTGGSIFQGDVLETGAGANVSVIFVDDTIFSLSESGRMVMDEMVYDPGTQTGTFNAQVVQGVFSFVSGQVAKTSPDGMVVSTPTATIGIRGSTGLVDLNNGKFALVNDVGGTVGELTITNGAGVVTLNQAGASTTVLGANSAPSTPVFLSPVEIQQNYGPALTKLVQVVAQKAQQDAQQATQQAQESAQEAQQAQAEAKVAADEAQQADEGAQQAEAEAEAAQAEADAALAEAEASGSPEAKAKAEAAQAKADEAKAQAAAEAKVAVQAKAAAEAKAGEAVAKTDVAKAVLAKAESAVQFNAMAKTAVAVQVKAFEEAVKTAPQQPNTGDKIQIVPIPDTAPKADTVTTTKVDQPVNPTPVPILTPLLENKPKPVEIPVNQAPLASNATLSVNEDAGTVSGKVTATDPENGALSYTLGTFNNSRATVTMDAAGNYTYTPAANVSGTDTFTYTVKDNGGLIATGTVTVNVAAVNDAPVAGGTLNDSMLKGGSIIFQTSHLNATDIDNTAAQLTYSVTAAAVNGTLRLNSTNSTDGTQLTVGSTFTQADVDAGRVAYYHNNGASTTDAFSFTVSDGALTTAAQTLNLAISNTLTVAAGSTLAIAANITPTTLINNGTVDVTAGTISTPTTVTNNATLNMGGTGTFSSATLTNASGAVVNYSGSGHLSNYLVNNGTINVTGTPGSLGILGFTNNGVLDIASGVTVIGAYNYAPAFASTSVIQGHGTFKTAVQAPYTYNAIWNPGTDGTVGVLTMDTWDANYSRTVNMSATTVLNIDIGGIQDGSVQGQDRQYDKLVLRTDHASTINGTMNLKAISGYTPTSGDSYTVLNYTTGSSGSFTITHNFGAGWNILASYGTTALTITTLSNAGAVTGTAGNDTLMSLAGNDTIDGGAGTDTLHLSSALANYTFAFPNTTTLTLSATAGTDGVDTITNVETLKFTDATVALGSKSLTGDSGNNQFKLAANQTGVSITGGGGSDTVTLNGASGDTNSVTLTNIAGTTGSAGSDNVVFTTALNNHSVDLGLGNDTVTLADTGNIQTFQNVEHVIGGAGNDTISLGTGLVAGDNATVDGGAGTDTLNLSDWDPITVTVTNVETINGRNPNDTIILGAAQTSGTIDLGGGTDSLTLANGTNNLTVTNTESIIGGTGADTILISGTVGATVNGNAGNDTITGGSGNDILIGGADADTLTGGAGVDIFRYTTVSDSSLTALDSITDFTAGAGGDQIDINITGSFLGFTIAQSTGTTLGALTASSIDALVNSTTGTLATKFAGGGTTFGMLLTTTDATSQTLLTIDVNGDGTFDATNDTIINVTGMTGTLDAANFV